MAIGIASNFNYGGKLPNFERDQFTTIEEMQTFPISSIDEGHISYCLEDKKHYKFNGTEWEEFKSGSAEITDYIADFINGGVVNINSTGTIEAVYNKLAKGGTALCIIGDSNGNYPSTSETRVNVNSKYLKATSYLFTTEPRGANVGDLLMITKRDYLLTTVCALKIIPINDCKLANGSYYATEGIITAWDKQRINKVDSIEATANSALQMPTYTESNMNNAVWSGYYPWCTLGRPNGATGAFSCVVTRSNNADFNGYYTIEQTAYGREAELGQIYKRLIFTKWDANGAEFLNWVKIGG